MTVGDGFVHFSHQHPLSFNINGHQPRASTSKRCHQDLNFVANILKLSSTVSQQHHNVSNMTVAVGDKFEMFITSLTKWPSDQFDALKNFCHQHHYLCFIRSSKTLSPIHCHLKIIVAKFVKISNFVVYRDPRTELQFGLKIFKSLVRLSYSVPVSKSLLSEKLELWKLRHESETLLTPYKIINIYFSEKVPWELKTHRRLYNSLILICYHIYTVKYIIYVDISIFSSHFWFLIFITFAKIKIYVDSKVSF